MKNAAAGIDIGGTKVRWTVIFDADAGANAHIGAGTRLRVHDAQEIETPQNQRQFENAFSAICAGLHAQGVKNIGVSAAGIIADGVLRKSPNLPAFRDVDFKQLAPRGAALRVDNDARCFARAETMRLPGQVAAREVARGDILAIILGTGVGRALVRRGKIIPMARFERPEPWEKEYQRHVGDPAPRLAHFLAPKLADLIRETRTTTVISGGGRFRTKDLYPELRKALCACGVRAALHRSRFRQNSAAIGAALLFC